MSALDVEGITVTYGAVTALNCVDLRVRSGEIVALMGPNGAGKSTLVLAIAGALQPRSGEIRWGGAPLEGPLHRRARRGIALLSEHCGVFKRLPVRANLELGRGGVHAALERIPELEQLLDRPAGLLSGGEQQMVRLARALGGRPSLLLADELSLGLAPRITERLLRELRTAADAGLSALIVEQHADQALAIADRAYVLTRGRMQLADVPAHELLGDTDRLLHLYLESDQENR